MLATALTYASMGFSVLPISRNDKRPLNERGVHGASRDREIIDRWFSKRICNIGIATGHASNLCVVDIDERSGGWETYGELAFQHGPLVTAYARTGGNGAHYLFRMPDVPAGHYLRGKLGKGIDVLGNAKYFVAPPSTHPSGHQYRWVVEPAPSTIAPMPTWLTNMIIAAEKPIVDHRPTNIDVVRLERVRKYLDAVPGAVSGQSGHNETFKLATKIVHGFGLDIDTAFALMAEWNNKCQPPWRDSDLRRKIQHAAKRGHCRSL